MAKEGIGIVDNMCPVNWQHPLNRGRLGWWKVVPNPGWRGGVRFRDLCRKNDGVVNGALTWQGGTRPGGYGNLASFAVGTTTTTYVDCGASSLLNPTGGITVAGWLYITTLATGNWFVTRDDNTLGRSFSFGANGSSQIQLQINGAATITTVETPLSGKTSTWFWFAFAGDTVNGYRVFWWHDILGFVKSATTNTWTAPVATTGATNIGRRTFAGSQGGFQGRGDDFSIWNRGFSDTQMKLLLLEARKGYPNAINWLEKPRRFWSTQAVVASGGGGTLRSGTLSSPIITGGRVVGK
jgi:hypothetical protein